MKGAIYQNIKTKRYIRMYSANDEQLLKGVPDCELIMQYTDLQRMERDFSELEKKTIGEATKR